MPPASAPATAGRAVRRTFLAVNAVPLGIGVVLSCSTALTAVRVYGRLTLGVVWAFLQLTLFLGSVWWYEGRADDLDDPGERPGDARRGSSRRDLGTASR
ncbi:hypothetical protein ABTX77_19455 [Streptomyces sp. NPDC097704]|uniref:hypothetical protein n=1 Tax=Streptomyces sp. NPDC097704 TaxID=3157101 RepID=UPI00332AB619